MARNTRYFNDEPVRQGRLFLSDDEDASLEPKGYIMEQRQRIDHPIPPLYDRDSRILILGSFPSVKSRESAFFYGHPQNRFWKVLAAILGEKIPETTEEKADMLHRNHIALWDTIASCEITGSSDSSIKNVVANDISPILDHAPITKIYCNGATSFRYYQRYIFNNTSVEAEKLPSTSPANAAWSLERLIDDWKVICAPLQILQPGMERALLSWYQYHARILPWRSEPTPYHIWISEIMLQQTRVETVKAYYERWMDELPDIQSLAQVSEEKMMKLWEGLGYYRRVKNLKEAACSVIRDYGGELPSDIRKLRQLKGIGEYTAGAIASIAYGKPEPAIDGNVLRIFSRILALKEPVTSTTVKNTVRKEVRKILPDHHAGDFNQALMDLGATVCLPNGAPVCDRCPWENICMACKEGSPQDYPIKQPKKKRRKQKLSVLVILWEDKVFLHKRAQDGLLAGLWEFPNYEGASTTESVLRWMESKHFQGKLVKELGPKKHVFTHIEWEMQGYLIKTENPDRELFEKEQWTEVDIDMIENDYAIPSAFAAYKEKLLNYYDSVRKGNQEENHEISTMH